MSEVLLPLVIDTGVIREFQAKLYIDKVMFYSDRNIYMKPLTVNYYTVDECLSTLNPDSEHAPFFTKLDCNFTDNDEFIRLLKLYSNYLLGLNRESCMVAVIKVVIDSEIHVTKETELFDTHLCSFKDNELTELLHDGVWSKPGICIYSHQTTLRGLTSQSIVNNRTYKKLVELTCSNVRIMASCDRCVKFLTKYGNRIEKLHLSSSDMSDMIKQLKGVVEFTFLRELDIQVELLSEFVKTFNITNLRKLVCRGTSNITELNLSVDELVINHGCNLKLRYVRQCETTFDVEANSYGNRDEYSVSLPESSSYETLSLDYYNIRNRLYRDSGYLPIVDLTATKLRRTVAIKHAFTKEQAIVYNGDKVSKCGGTFSVLLSTQFATRVKGPTKR